MAPLLQHQAPESNQQVTTFRNIQNNTDNVVSPITSVHQTAQDADNATVLDKEVENGWILRAGLLAASSSAKFFRTVFGSSDRIDTQVGGDHGTELARDDTIETRKLPNIDASTSFDLPLRKEADALIHRFWTNVYIQWFDRTEFLTWYESIWTSKFPVKSVDEKINLALLNLVFALVYRTEPDFEDDQDNLAQTHFARAQGLLQISVLELDRINLLYALFLMLQWYQSVNDVKQCLSLIRLCLVVAQNIGIDDTERVAAYKSQRQQEMARRAWHGCVLMDRIIAMVSGRPLHIPQSTAKTIPLFTSIDDRYLSSNGEYGLQPPDVFSDQEFFLQFCRLHLILGEIVQDNHYPSDHNLNVNRINEIDAAFHDFDENLPRELHYSPTNNQFIGQSVHLRTRFLYLKILLYRPCFTRKPGNTTIHSKTSPLASILTHQCLLKCVDAATELLALLDTRHAAGDRRPGTIPQWWHTIGYVYSASTIVIAAHLFTEIWSTKQKELERAIQQGFNILDSYKRYRLPAQRCKKALDTLYTRYVMQKNVDVIHSRTSDYQDTGLPDLPWAWESVMELFDDNFMFDFAHFN